MNILLSLLYATYTFFSLPLQRLSNDNTVTMPSKDPARVAAGLRGALTNPNVSEEAKESAMRQLDGFTNAHAHAQKERVSEEPPESESQHRVQENDEELDPETLRNTRANERVLRVPKDVHKGENGDKHVNFVDETASRKLIAQQKALMRKPKAPKADKAEARDFLEFHGEIGV